MLTQHPLKSIIKIPQAIGWITKWAMELKPYDIKYEIMTIIKGQVLARLLNSLWEPQHKETTKEGRPSMWMELQTTKVLVSASSW